MIPTVTISSRGEERLRSGHPWIYRSDVVQMHARRGDRVLVRDPRGRTLGHAFYSDRSQIALRMLTHGDQPADDALVRRRIEPALAFRERAGDRRVGIPARSRRGRSAAVGHRRSLRRLPGRADALAGRRPPAAADRLDAGRASCVRAASWRATIRGRARSKGSSRASTCWPARCPSWRTGHRERNHVRRRSPARPEDRTVSRSAREPERGRALRAAAACSTASATTAVSR